MSCNGPPSKRRRAGLVATQAPADATRANDPRVDLLVRVETSECPVPTCRAQLERVHNEMRCDACGYVENMLEATSRSLAYGEEANFSNTDNDKNAHLREWLNLFQTKTHRVIPAETLQKVSRDLWHAGDIRQAGDITFAAVRASLKRLGMKKQLVAHVLYQLTGVAAPRLTVLEETMFCLMYQAVAGIYFDRYRPEDRHHLLSFSYLLLRFAYLRGMDHYLQYFQILKGLDKIRTHERIFSAICADPVLDWECPPIAEIRARVLELGGVL